MSNRTLVELNHDFCPRDEKLLEWAKAMQAYMRSGDRADLPRGVTFKHMRHHSEPCPLEAGPEHCPATPSLPEFSPDDKHTLALYARNMSDVMFHSPHLVATEETMRLFLEERLLTFAKGYHVFAEAAAREAGIEEAAKAVCEWCEQGKPFSEPMYGRTTELWHIPFPDVPENTQRIRCQAEKILALKDSHPAK